MSISIIWNYAFSHSSVQCFGINMYTIRLLLQDQFALGVVVVVCFFCFTFGSKIIFNYVVPVVVWRMTAMSKFKCSEWLELCHANIRNCINYILQVRSWTEWKKNSSRYLFKNEILHKKKRELNNVGIGLVRTFVSMCTFVVCLLFLR